MRYILAKQTLRPELALRLVREVENLQATKSEDATHGESVLPYPLQSPNDGQWKT